MGRIAAEFANLEDSVRQLLAHLMRSDRTLVIAAGENMGNLLNMCQRVAAFDTSLADEQVDQLNGLVAVISTLQGLRNAGRHAQWYPTSLARHFYGSRSRRPSPSATGLESPLYWTLEYAIALADDIHTATMLVDRYSASLPADHKPTAPWSRTFSKNFDNLFAGIHIGTQ